MKSCGCTGGLPCGCCAGVEPVTPESEVNRPGLPALRYRAGTHATFLETMKADLSKDRRLDGLSVRDASDGSIALLDAWATIGDVLTFYQERIANEGYLGTATERRSVMELANLVGYRPRPGVSASVFVAYTLDDGAETTIPAGSLVRSVPADGEAQQAFETSEPLEAEASWNNLQVRLTRPHTKKSILTSRAIYLKGLVSSVHKGDPLLVAFAERDVALCRILDVQQDAPASRTKVSLEEWTPSGHFQIAGGSELAQANALRPFLRIEDFGLTLTNATVKAVLPILENAVNVLDSGTSAGVDDAFDGLRSFEAANPPKSAKARVWLDALLEARDAEGPGAPPTVVSVDEIASDAGLLEPASLSPRSQYHRSDDLDTLFGTTAEKDDQTAHVAGSVLSTLTAFRQAFRQSLSTALAGAHVTDDPDIRVYSVTRTAPFGYNAPPQASTDRGGDDSPGFTTTWSEWPLDSADASDSSPIRDKLDLEKEFDAVTLRTPVAVQIGSTAYTTPALKDVTVVSRAAYGLAGKSTRLLFQQQGTVVVAERPRPASAGQGLPRGRSPAACRAADRRARVRF